MATDWAADVKKYAANADDAAIAGIVRYCGIALRNRDSSMVAFSDKTETDRVRTNFLQKKLALTHPQGELDAAIAKVGAAMKGDRTKNRVTVYYLLAQEFGKLAMFVSKAGSKAAGAGSKAAGGLPVSVVAVPAKPAAKAAPKTAAKAPAAKAPVAKAAKATKTPVAANGSAAAVTAKPARSVKPPASMPASAKAAAPIKAAAPAKITAPAKVTAPAKATTPAKVTTPGKAAGKPAAKQAAVTTKKTPPTKTAVSTAAAAPAAKQGLTATHTAASKDQTPAAAGTIAAATALGGAAIAAAASGAEAVKDAGAKVAGLGSDTVSTVVPSGSTAASGSAPAAAAPAVRPAMAAQSAATVPSDEDSGLGWLYWVLGGLVLLALLWFLLNRNPADETGVAAVPTEAAAVVAPAGAPAPAAANADLAAAQAEGSAAIPQGAGVTTETRDGKPVVKVYFDTGKTDLAAAFAGAAGGLKAYLADHSGAVLNVSGYSDPSGNAAANAELSKNRAQAVQAALVAAGIPEAAAKLVKPDSSADASVPKEAARRVEVVVN